MPTPINSTLIHGLYAISRDLRDTQQLVDEVRQAIAGGIGVLQYRNKLAEPSLRLAQASALRELCWQHQLPLIINDHVELAAEVDADGVHLGGEDGCLQAAPPTTWPRQMHRGILLQPAGTCRTKRQARCRLYCLWQLFCLAHQAECTGGRHRPVTTRPTTVIITDCLHWRH